MPITGIVERGSIVWLDLYPTRGHEQQGWRPALVISDGLIDPSFSTFAMIVPITEHSNGKNAFEVSVPSGITTTHAKYKILSGYALTNQAKSLDLDARKAEVIGRVDPKSMFYQTVVTYVRAILAD